MTCIVYTVIDVFSVRTLKFWFANQLQCLDYALIDSHERSTHTHRVYFVMLPG